MKKYLFVFLLISLVIILPVIFYHHWSRDLELIFVLDPDNYDILEFISPDNNGIYAIFLLANLFLIVLALFKNYFNKLSLGFGIHQPSNLTNKLQTRSPPLAY